MRKRRLPWEEEQDKEEKHREEGKAVEDADYREQADVNSAETEKDTEDTASASDQKERADASETADTDVTGQAAEEEDNIEKKSFWSRISHFSRLSLILLLLSILMAAVFWFLHRIPSMAVSLLQVIGILTALLFHNKKLKSSKKWINRTTILLLVIVVMAVNLAVSVQKMTHSRSIADRNAARQSDSGSEQLIPMPLSTEECIGQEYSDIYRQLKDAGFTAVDCQPVEDLAYDEADKIGTVASVLIEGNGSFLKDQKYAKSGSIIINYHTYQTCTLNLNIVCKGNLLFNKYDLDFYVNDSLQAVLEHGTDSSHQIQLTPGNCTLRFEKTGAPEVKGEYKLKITGDTDLTLKISCEKEKVTVEAE